MLGEGRTVAVRIEDILAGVEENTDPVEVEERLELADQVVPCSGVVTADQRGESGKCFYLDVVVPPGGAEDEAIPVA